MTKENWRKRWLESIYELTNIELQTLTWLDKTNTNPYWSFIEFTSCYFDDLLDNCKYDYCLSKNFITEFEYNVLKDWHIKLEAYDSPNKDDYDNEAILSDPKWREIIEVGREMKNNLSNILSEKEKQILQIGV